MSTTTTNYGLIKPALTDVPDITAFNGNWDKIDTELNGIDNGTKYLKEVKVRNADNGYGKLFKNNGATADYGVNLVDYDSTDKNISLILSALYDLLQYKDSAGNLHDVLHAGNFNKHAVPLTGGTMSGNLTVEKTGEGVNAQVVLKTNKRTICLANDAIENGGAAGIYNYADGKWIIYTDADNNVNIPHTIHSNGKIVFSEGNKPFGSYTGNGSATARTINTGGIGRAVIVYKAGRDSFFLATPQGAIFKNNKDIGADSSTTIMFVNGVLTIASNHELLNASGGTYYYQVL